MADNTLFDKYGHVVDDGKIIFKEGDEGDEMYIIQDGSVRISKNIDGKEYTLAVLGKGDFFGEMAIVNRVKRTATAIAADTLRYLSFNREGFVNMIEKNSKIALNIIDRLCRRLQQANLQIHHLKKNNEKGLIAMNIYYAFAEEGLENALLDMAKVTREISMSLEISPERIMEVMRELKDTEIITEVEGDKMRLLDGNRLQEIGKK